MFKSKSRFKSLFFHMRWKSNQYTTPTTIEFGNISRYNGTYSISVSLENRFLKRHLSQNIWSTWVECSKLQFWRIIWMKYMKCIWLFDIHFIFTSRTLSKRRVLKSVIYFYAMHCHFHGLFKKLVVQKIRHVFLM